MICTCPESYRESVAVWMEETEGAVPIELQHTTECAMSKKLSTGEFIASFHVILDQPLLADKWLVRARSVLEKVGLLTMTDALCQGHIIEADIESPGFILVNSQTLEAPLPTIYSTIEHAFSAAEVAGTQGATNLEPYALLPLDMGCEGDMLGEAE